MLELRPIAEVSHLKSVIDQLILDALDKGQIVEFRAGSNSMKPTIKVGMVIKVQRASIQVGDIILGVFGGEFRIHRLIQLTETHAIMQGDASDFTEKIPRSDIAGKVMSFHDDWRGVARRAAGSVRSFVPKSIWNLGWRLIDRGNDKKWTELHD
jgi:hypothetical protein